MAEKRLGAKELRGLSAADLQTKLQGLKQDLWQARLKAREGALQQTHQLSAARREIARIMTVLRSPSTRPGLAQGESRAQSRESTT